MNDGIGLFVPFTPLGDAANTTAMAWTLFSGIFTQIDGVLTAATAPMIQGLAQWSFRLLVAWAVVLVAALALATAGVAGDIIDSLFPLMMRIAVIGTIITSAANVQTWVVTPLIETLPTEMGQAMLGDLGNVPPTGGQPFDTIVTKLSGLTAQTMARLNPLSPKELVFMIAVAFGFMWALLAVTVQFAAYLVTHIVVIILSVFAPVALALWVAESTRSYFWGWMKAVTSLVLYQVLIVAVLALSLSLITNMLAQEIAAPDDANALSMVFGMLETAALIWIFAVVISIAGIYASIVTGGAAHSMTPFAASLRRMGPGPVLGGGGSARPAPTGGSAPSGGGDGVPAHAFRTAGRNLSNG